MDLATPDTAVELGEAAEKLLRTHGGVQLCRDAEADLSRREAVGELLGRLGTWELDPRADHEEAMAAAEVVRASGAVALPYPVVGRMLKQEARWLGVAAGCRGRLRLEHGDLANGWLVAGLDGSSGVAARLPTPSPQKLAPFLSRGDEPRPTGEPVPDREIALWLTLDAFWILGAAETALARTVQHTLDRHQFGRPLASFQAIRMRTAEAVTCLEGLRTLARYTVWHHFVSPRDVMPDALALRLVALESVQAVFSAAHQFHGALGFSLEHDVALLHRHVQGHVRLPVDHDELGRLLVAEIDRVGFDSLYGRFQGPGRDDS